MAQEGREAEAEQVDYGPDDSAAAFLHDETSNAHPRRHRGGPGEHTTTIHDDGSATTTTRWV